MKKYLFLIILGIVLSLSVLTADDNYLYININSVILASDPDEAAYKLAAWAEDNGGYFTMMSTTQVILRFPWDKAKIFRSYLEEAADDVFSYTSSSTDLRENILSFRSGIEAREEILFRNMKLVNSADFNGTLFLEQEILRLMSEIEDLKGQLNKAENDRKMAYAVITISFQSQTLPQNIPSSFQWINTISFYDFINRNFSSRGNGADYKVEKPEGFAFVRNKTVYQAISPEGVRFQVRKEKNYPKKDVDFWAPAFVRQLEEGGYRKRNEGEYIDTPMGRAFVIEWGMPLGNQDYIYLTAIIPHKKHIYIIEAAGEYTLYENYKDQLYDAVGTLSR